MVNIIITERLIRIRWVYGFTIIYVVPCVYKTYTINCTNEKKQLTAVLRISRWILKYIFFMLCRTFKDFKTSSRLRE